MGYRTKNATILVSDLRAALVAEAAEVPEGFTFVTVTADYDLANGLDPVGAVSFIPSEPMVNDDTVVSAAVTRALNVDGVLLIDLAANTDPATTTPSGDAPYYLVEESINGATRRYAVTIPHDAGPLVNLATLTHSAISTTAVSRTISALPKVTYPVSGPPGPPGPPGPAGDVGNGITQAAADLRYVQVTEAPLSLKDPRVGCVLDGTGDESAKVATAIGMLPTGGGHIYQPPGTLRTGAISFDKPVRWEGAGDQASTILAASGFAGSLITITSAAPFSRISDVQIGGGAVATKLVVVAAPRTRLDHLHLTGQSGSGGAAIHFDGVDSTNSSHAGQLSDVRIINCDGYGILLQGFSYDNEFNNLWIGSCNVGIRYENTNGFFNNTHVWGCTSNGIELRGGNHLFSNCYIETNGGSGFNIFNGPRVRISNCNIWKNQGQGVSISGTSDRPSIVGCLIYDNGGNGIQAADCLYGQVVGCTMYDDTSSAQTQDRPVVTTGTSDSWVITSNVIRTADHASGGNSLVGASNVSANNIT